MDSPPHPLLELVASGRLEAVAARYARCRHEAEDLLGELYVSWIHRPPRHHGQLLAYARTCLRNAAIDRSRKRSRTQPWPTDAEGHALEPPAHGPDPGAAAALAEARRHLQEALETLPAADRALVRQRYYDGLSASAIAERTGSPAATVRSRLRRALARLRGRLRGPDQEGERC